MPRLKVSVTVTRGDVTVSAECSASSALAVLRYLAEVVRTGTAEAPDLLPYPDAIPGTSVPYTDDGDTDARRLGFR